MGAGAVDELLAATLDAACNGRAGAVGIYGPRGSGKSWTLTRAASLAAERDMTIACVEASDEDHEVPFAALAALLAPFRAHLDKPAWEPLRPVLDLDPRRVDPLDVKLAAFRVLCELAAEQPICVLLDDTDRFDAASFGVISFAARRADADAIAFVATSTDDSSPVANTSLRLDPLTVPTIERLLLMIGLDAGVATRCAEASSGNPGIAKALADGLTDQQRSGSAPVAMLPRPSGGLVDKLQGRLTAHGDEVCRALVVAAAEHSGEISAVRAALVTLGESTNGLDRAEDLGLIEIVGSRFVFHDPWVRAVSYHLVAPSSRRAAHRALAGWFDDADQGAERAWHLAAGADGPSATVTEALELVAADAARRGGSASAAITAERASEFSVTPEDRQRTLLAALRWWIEVGSTDGVRRVLRVLDPLDHDAAVARTEALEFLHGGRQDVSWNGQHTGGPWTNARAERITIATHLEQGDHRAATKALDRATSLPAARQALACAVARRQAGQTRHARDAATSALAGFDHSEAYEATVARLVAADLDILHGRSDDAIHAIGNQADLPAGLHSHAAALAARASLQRDPTLSPSSQPDAFIVLGRGPLGEVQASIEAGVLGGDPQALVAAIELAERHLLPIEAGEARLWLSGLQSSHGRGPMITLARATLDRCGVRGWEQRLALLSAEPGGSDRVRRSDPGLEALSQAEFRVAEAVASGLTNREVAAALIISVKTVDFHLQQMYRKLGIRSRTELAVRMANFDPATGGTQR